MFTLRTLFVVVGIAALAVATIVSDVAWLTSAFVVLTLGILCWGFLLRETAFWRGLLVFGVVYFVIASSSHFREAEDVLPSTILYRVMTANDDPFDARFDRFPPVPADPFDDRDDPSEITVSQGMAIHGMCSLLFGTIGGLLYQWHTGRKKGGT